jgi:hypothetical protein|tara:strand:- start:452 stop:793 length:342 start_codon:yes stop_codon:yes gene_type:complete
MPLIPTPVFDPSTAFNARTTDPDTSHTATTRIRPSDKARVLDAFEQAGMRGLTDRELQAGCPESTLSRLESWRKRRSDLTREGALIDTDERRDGQIVWRTRAHHQQRPFVLTP